MKAINFTIFLVLIAHTMCHGQQAWFEGTWNVRVVNIDPEERDTSLIESVTITVSGFDGQQISVTTPGDDGPETQVFSVLKSGDLLEATAQSQSSEGNTTEVELLRAFRIDDDLAFVAFIGFGGNGEALSPIYFADGVAGIMSKGSLPAKLSTSGLAGTYRGFSFGLEVLAGTGWEDWTELVEASFTTAGSGYQVTPEGENELIALTNQNSYLQFTDFSQLNLSSTGNFESLLVFPITSTEIVFLRLGGEGLISDPFINFSFVDGEAGILSRDPDYQIPEFVNRSWYSSADEIQPAGWRYFNWFKGFRPKAGSDWIFHGRHGWLFMQADDTSRMFVWDVALGRWMFTNASVYPWMYAYGPNEGWVFFFEGGSPGKRFFQRGDSGQVISEQDLSLNR